MTAEMEEKVDTRCAMDDGASVNSFNDDKSGFGADDGESD